jgi:hypothetical protein
MTPLLYLLLLLDLDSYRWKNRVLLQIGGGLPPAEMPAGFAERDLLWLWTEKEEVRKRFRAGAKAVWILIGKDGGEKSRWTKAPKPEELFRLIDAMPMRQAEINRKK